LQYEAGTKAVFKINRSIQYCYLRTCFHYFLRSRYHHTAQSFAPKKAQNTIIWICVCLFAPAFGLLIGKAGLKIGLGLLVLPFVVYFVYRIFLKPEVGLHATLVLAFLASGLTRYLPLPWGLGLDILLFLSWLALLFLRFNKTDWTPLRTDFMLLSLLWYGYICAQILNPEARSLMAWFYAMRGYGFYQLLVCGLVLMCYIRRPQYLDTFLHYVLWLSVMGTLWGIRQKYMGTDAVEDHWLYAEGHHDEHVLFGVLRVFSFYSDAGQFGASQAMVALMSGILFLGPYPLKKKLLYLFVALLTFFGFAISGTRGALAVPAAGGLIYLITTKNFKILLMGLMAGMLIFGVLKYTTLFHNIEQVRRMRTALDPDNPSLHARLRNQVTFGNYLRSKPLGGGVGSAGYWGARFSPNTLLAQTPTDSWYVKIWAETGLVGICLHLFVLGYFMGKGGYIIWKLKNKQLKNKIMAIYAGLGGVLLSSYGNQVFGQMPTGMVVGIIIPLIALAPYYDKLLEAATPEALPKNG